MRNVTAAVMVSTLAFMPLVSHAAAEFLTGVHWSQSDNSATRNIGQNHMFDGINLTEQQRQQMRDLMQQARHDSLPIDVSEMENMHRLITADKFDEAAVKAQAEKMVQEQVSRQVEMAKIRNQMYHLLSQDQQVALNKRYQQRMDRFRELSGLQQGTLLQTMSSTATRSNP